MIHLFDRKRLQANISYFTTTFFVALFYCVTYYTVYLLLDLNVFRGIPGLFSPDSAGYHVFALRIVNENFSKEIIDTTITDHYHPIFLAIQMYVFGSHPLITKIYQVLLFSIGVTLWTRIARDVLQEKIAVKYFFYLLLFCIPLLTYNAHVLKEISLFLATSISFYGFTRYYYKQGKKSKYLWITLMGIILMFLFRREFALVMFLSFVFAFLLGSGLSFQKKAIWMVVSALFYVVISNLPIFQQIGALDPMTEGGRVFVARGESSRVAADIEGDTGGMIGSARFLFTNPTVAFPMFIYGISQLFFHPPFLYTPSEMIARGNISYLAMGYYNAIFVLLLPAFYFGARQLYREKKGNSVLIAFLLYFIFASLGAIFGSDSYRRFKVSYFWPIAYIYISYGIVTYPLWKKKLPLVALVFIALFFMYFAFDFIGLVS